MNRHGDTASAFCFSAQQPFDPWALENAIGALQASFGRDLLRMKGLVEIQGHPSSPRVLHVVGHVASPPRLLDGWPEGINQSRLILIVAGPGRAAAATMVQTFLPDLIAFIPGSAGREAIA
ncbi:hypothetical protein LNKW23_47160 [Paralimibaculum aggregatum]|uniref:CobW C-terminal domain-containing protein n=1 Tax=Paralimibaculum aggregatum TaxID=3036245 RepID=A0ABQ6LTT1_9RHOB|nr:hypothetical protein LNKW23_47160 [Limibaculum sp. NKW23]